ncbi:hypothetical protein ACCI36_004409 [Vibrio parahaemolyticus]
MSSISEAVKDAAIANINEDLYEINKQIEALPEGLQQYVAEFKTSITHMGESLEKALEAVPETFDHNITDNLAKAVEVAEAIEQATREFNESMRHQQLNLQEHLNTTNDLHQRELEAMQSKYERSMRMFNEEATARGEKAMKNSEIACNNVIQKFEDNCVVPALWVWVLPIGGGIVSAMFVLFMLIITKLLPF